MKISKKLGTLIKRAARKDGETQFEYALKKIESSKQC